MKGVKDFSVAEHFAMLSESIITFHRTKHAVDLSKLNTRLISKFRTERAVSNIENNTKYNSLAVSYSAKKVPL